MSITRSIIILSAFVCALSAIFAVADARDRNRSSQQNNAPAAKEACLARLACSSGTRWSKKQCRCVGGLADSYGPAPPPLDHPSGLTHVSVSGADLLLNGKKWVPHGVQFLGLLSPTATPTACANNTGPAYMHLGQAGLDAAHTWDADVVRYQVSQYALDPANATGFSPDYVNRVKQTVAMARRSGFVVIVSMQHETCSGAPRDHAMPTVETKRAWDTIAPSWVNDGGVMLELFNEPELPANTANWAVWQNGGVFTKKDSNGNTTSETAIGHQDLINEVRSLGSKNVLIVDGMHYAKELEGMPGLKDPMSNLVFAAHPFFGSSTAKADASSWPKYFGRLSKHVPVLVTAWNTSNSACEIYYPDLAKVLLKYLNDNQIGIVGVDFDVLTTIVSDFHGTPNYFDGGWSCAAAGKTTTGEGAGQLLCQEFRAAKGDPTERCNRGLPVPPPPKCTTPMTCCALNGGTWSGGRCK